MITNFWFKIFVMESIQTKTFGKMTHPKVLVVSFAIVTKTLRKIMCNCIPLLVKVVIGVIGVPWSIGTWFLVVVTLFRGTEKKQSHFRWLTKKVCTNSI